MAHKRKGQLTVADSWNKHFNKFLKRIFWKKERKKGKQFAKQASKELE